MTHKIKYFFNLKDRIDIKLLAIIILVALYCLTGCAHNRKYIVQPDISTAAVGRKLDQVSQSITDAKSSAKNTGSDIRSAQEILNSLEHNQSLLKKF